MKVALIYPPFRKGKEFPLLSQNRQFKFSKSLEVRIYPVVMATFATMLKQAGHEVLFLDGINARMSMEKFEQKLFTFKPDVVVLETKTPIMQTIWAYTDRLKRETKASVVLVGDHVSFFPGESIEKSKADFVITGGDYDFVGTELVDCIAKKRKTAQYPKGVWWKKGNSGKTKFHDLAGLPRIDRDLTNWKLYGEAYLYRPVAYILSGRGCGRSDDAPGVCSFCVWQHALWNCTHRLRPAAEVVDEIKHLVEDYGVKEVFDDNESGFLYSESYTEQFYNEMVRANLIGKVKISMNARAEALTDKVCMLMKKMGGRLLKIGVESGNGATLERIQKKETTAEIEAGIRKAKDYNLRVLLTNMVGYPWETEEEVKISYERLKRLMFYKIRFGDSLQASIVVPYPGTPLYREAVKNKWFLISPKDYEKFDMSVDVLKSPIDTTMWCRKFWSIQTHPLYLLRSFLSIRSFADIKVAVRGLFSLIGHLRDY
ncbi:MAG: B12-binding domain-containing radical SAM protein [Spirochaetes bacterium]|nr:B12-binding domain-containing radical SAM protein [Spirochaetota bacterium]